MLKIVLLFVFMWIPLENLTLEELDLLGGFPVPFMTFKNSWRENPDKLIEGVFLFLLAKEAEEAGVDAGLMCEILAAGDNLNEVIKQVLGNLVQFTPDFAAVLDVELLGTDDPLADQLHNLKQPKLGLHVGAEVEDVDYFQQRLQEYVDALALQQPQVAVEQVAVEEKEELVFPQELISVEVQVVLGKFEVPIQIALDLAHLRTFLEGLQHLAGVELTMDQNAGVALLHKEVDYLLALLAPKDLEYGKNLFLQTSHRRSLLLEALEGRGMDGTANRSVLKVREGETAQHQRKQVDDGHFLQLHPHCKLQVVLDTVPELYYLSVLFLKVEVLEDFCLKDSLFGEGEVDLGGVGRVLAPATLDIARTLVVPVLDHLLNLVDIGGLEQEEKLIKNPGDKAGDF